MVKLVTKSHINLKHMTQFKSYKSGNYPVELDLIIYYGSVAW